MLVRSKKSASRAVEGAIEAIETNTVPSSVLVLNGVGMGNQGAQAVARALPAQATRSLTELRAAHNYISDAGAASLARHGAGLSVLVLSANEIGDDGAAALGRMLRGRAPATSVLGLWGNDIGARGALALARGLRKARGLEQLDLGFNPRMGGAGVRSLAKGLVAHPGLRVLNLSRNGLDDDAIRSLAKGLVSNSSLAVLDLSRNAFGDPGAKHLAKVFYAKRCALASLNLRSTWFPKLKGDGVVDDGPGAEL